MNLDFENNRRMEYRRRRGRELLFRRVLTIVLLAMTVVLVMMFVSFVKEYRSEQANADAAIGTEETQSEQLSETVGEESESAKSEANGGEQGAADLNYEPVAGQYLVVVDPGHGGKDQGCAYGDVIEKDIALDASYRLRDALVKAGVSVVMTRDDDYFLYMNRRVELAETVGCNLYISIHADSFDTDTSVNGLTVHHQTGATRGKEAAFFLHDKLETADFHRIRSVKASDYYVLRNTSMPAVLVELGFVTNEDDAAKMTSADFLDQVAGVLAEGIVEYLDSVYAGAE